MMLEPSLNRRPSPRQGEKVYTCTVCGATRTEVIPMLTHDHNFTWTVISKATVFAPEKQEGICSICGAKQSRDNGSKLTATMKLNVTSIKLQKKQTTTKVKATGLANGGFREVLDFQQQKRL